MKIDFGQIKQWFIRGALISIIMMIVTFIELAIGLSVYTPGTDFKVIGILVMLLNWIILGAVAGWVIKKF